MENTNQTMAKTGASGVTTETQTDKLKELRTRLTTLFSCPTDEAAVSDIEDALQEAYEYGRDEADKDASEGENQKW